MTLLELLIVLVLAAILGALAAWTYSSQRQQAERMAATALLEQDASFLEQFYSQHGSYKLSATQWPALPYGVYPESGTPLYRLAFSTTPRNTDADYYVLRATAEDGSEGYIEMLQTGVMRRCAPAGTLWQCRHWP